MTKEHQIKECVAEICKAHQAVVFSGDLVAKHGKESIAAALKAGQFLCQAEKLTKHGKWMKWLGKTFPKINYKTLSRYMMLYKNWTALSNVDKNKCETLNQAYIATKVTGEPPAKKDSGKGKGKSKPATSKPLSSGQTSTVNGEVPSNTATLTQNGKEILDEKIEALCGNDPQMLAKALMQHIHCSEGCEDNMPNLLRAVKPIYQWYLEKTAGKPKTRKGNSIDAIAANPKLRNMKFELNEETEPQPKGFLGSLSMAE